MVFEKKINVLETDVDLSGTKLKGVLQYCNLSEQYVLTEKYGLVGGKSKSLQKIGQKFDMSRERIRQILNKSLNKVRRFIQQDKDIEQIIEQAKNILKNNYSLQDEESLINSLLDNKLGLNYNELLLVLSSDYDLYYLTRNKRFKKIFYIEPLFEDLINDLHDGMFNLIQNENKPLSKDFLFYKLKSLFLNKFNRNNSIIQLLKEDKLYENIVKFSRYLYMLDNLVGLEEHEQVNPKTIKLKIKYVLSKENKPLHYEQVAKKIKELFNLKTVRVATIHNELVKNKDFINVGMGIYGLSSWGYNGENTLELIKSILEKNNRPMTSKEIVAEVLKERMVKEVTVLLVLQKHKDIFTRVGKGLYQLKK